MNRLCLCAWLVVALAPSAFALGPPPGSMFARKPAPKRDLKQEYRDSLKASAELKKRDAEAAAEARRTRAENQRIEYDSPRNRALRAQREAEAKAKAQQDAVLRRELLNGDRSRYYRDGTRVGSEAARRAGHMIP